LPVLPKRVAAPYISRLAVPTDQDFLAALIAEAAPYFARAGPDQLGVMRNVLGSSSLAIRWKHARNKILLLGNPAIDHGFRPKSSRRTAPYVFALKRATGNVRRVLELSRLREVIRPSLRSLRQV